MLVNLYSLHQHWQLSLCWHNGATMEVCAWAEERQKKCKAGERRRWERDRRTKWAMEVKPFQAIARASFTIPSFCYIVFYCNSIFIFVGAVVFFFDVFFSLSLSPQCDHHFNEKIICVIINLQYFIDLHVNKKQRIFQFSIVAIPLPASTGRLWNRLFVNVHLFALSIDD